MLFLAEIKLIFFIVSSREGAMFWICAKTSRDGFIIAEHYTESFLTFSAPHTTQPVRSPEVHKKLGGITARTADPKGSSK